MAHEKTPDGFCINHEWQFRQVRGTFECYLVCKWCPASTRKFNTLPKQIHRKPVEHRHDLRPDVDGMLYCILGNCQFTIGVSKRVK